MIAWVSFVSIARSTPLTMAVPSSRPTCKFLSSSSGNFVRAFFLIFAAILGRFVTHRSQSPRRPEDAVGDAHRKCLRGPEPETALLFRYDRLDQPAPHRDPAVDRAAPL